MSGGGGYNACPMRVRERLPLIICFGDSLTAGYQSSVPDCPEIRETPYGAFLQELMGHRARVAISGVCGELTGDMVKRFRRDVLAHAPASVVILGGANDLGWNVEPADIVRNLLHMYEQAMGAGIRPVAVTVPSIRAEEADEARWWLERHVQQRLVLNRLMADSCRARGMTCLDLFAATAEPGTLQLAERYSNDGLHLTTEGYRKLADLLYQEVFHEQ